MNLQLILARITEHHSSNLHPLLTLGPQDWWFALQRGGEWDGVEPCQCPGNPLHHPAVRYLVIRDSFALEEAIAETIFYLEVRKESVSPTL